MSQIMQIAKEKNLRSFPTLDRSEINQGSLRDLGLNAKDMIGLSWIFLDHPSLYLANPERRCMVIE